MFRLFLGIFFLTAVSAPLSFAAQNETVAALTDYSLEELMDVRITSVSRRPEGAFYAAAPVFILTNEDIRRSGATNIPEALRMVPGLNVYRIDTNNYVISGSTNNDYFTEKVLVLIDGRPLQSQTFSQVFWPSVMYPLEDIERIEVIHGSGSAQWGANAMNAVINIITKSARQTESGFVSGGGGDREIGFGTVREGWNVKDGVSARVYAMMDQSGGARVVSGERSPNPRDGGPQDNYKKANQAGFRVDGERAESRYSIHGDAYRVSAMSVGASYVGLDSPGTKHFEFDDVYTGGNLEGRLEKDEDAALNWSLQFGWDNQSIKRVFFSENNHIFKFEPQVNWRSSEGNILSVGASGKLFMEGFENSAAMQKPNATTDETGVFANDELLLAGDHLKLSAGLKAERNTYVDWQLQPGVRASWDEENWMAWAAATKTSRLPNNANNKLNWINDYTAITLPDGNNYPFLGMVVSNGGAAPEELYAYESGVRARPSSNLTIDVNGFYNQYKNVLALFEEPTQHLVYMGGQYVYVYDISYRNSYDGVSYGGTVSMDWKPVVWLRMFGGYTYTRVNMELIPGLVPSRKHDFSDYMTGSTPIYSFKGGIFVDLPYRWQVDATGIYVERVPALSVGEYFQLNLRLAWHPTDRLEVAAEGRNLTRYQHAEFYSPSTVDNAWVNQDYFFKATYQF